MEGGETPIGSDNRRAHTHNLLVTPGCSELRLCDCVFFNLYGFTSYFTFEKKNMYISPPTNQRGVIPCDKTQLTRD